MTGLVDEVFTQLRFGLIHSLCSFAVVGCRYSRRVNESGVRLSSTCVCVCVCEREREREIELHRHKLDKQCWRRLRVSPGVTATTGDGVL